MVEYIHYGHTEFSKELFQSIKNREMFAKPTGGFWASRLNSLYGLERIGARTMIFGKAWR